MFLGNVASLCESNLFTKYFLFNISNPNGQDFWGTHSINKLIHLLLKIALQITIWLKMLTYVFWGSFLVMTNGTSTWSVFICLYSSIYVQDE